jgi:hypothetical protein
MKIKSLVQLYDSIPENEMIIVDVLRNIVTSNLPSYCKEKISYNVPYFFGNKGICIIWPSGIPRGGIKSGVLLGFWNGYLLKDQHQYLNHGTNKKIYYRIYNTIEEIDQEAIVSLLKEAAALDFSFKK